MPWPFRNTATVREASGAQSSSRMGVPSSRSQAMSGSLDSPAGAPVKKRRRRKIGCSARRRVSCRVKTVCTSWWRASAQSIQLISLSWA
jgi:hypothetical protein